VDRIEVGVTMADIMGIPGSEWDSQQTWFFSGSENGGYLNIATNE
jgi:hypothetical protein